MTQKASSKRAKPWQGATALTLPAVPAVQQNCHTVRQFWRTGKTTRSFKAEQNLFTLTVGSEYCISQPKPCNPCCLSGYPHILTQGLKLLQIHQDISLSPPNFTLHTQVPHPAPWGDRLF